MKLSCSLNDFLELGIPVMTNTSRIYGGSLGAMQIEGGSLE